MDSSLLTEARLDDVVTLQWTLAEDEIRLRIAFSLPEPLDDEEYWLGFGISDQGGMVGSDLAIFVPSYSNATEDRLIDVHGILYGYPTIDKCGQDWRLIGHSRTENDETFASTLHTLEISRSLQSNDINEDLPILNDEFSTNVLAAWGRLNLGGSGEESDGRKEQKKRSLESLQYLDDLASMILPHGPSGRVSGHVRFFERQQTQQNGQDDFPYIDLIPNLYSIPDSKTTYKNFCFQLEDFPELQQVLLEHEQVHIVGFQDMSESPLVHHMDLHGTESEKLGADKRLCRVYMDLIHPWEQGSPTRFNLPEVAGIPLGKGGYRAFRVEVHYHNPRRLAGLQDSSGVRVYYSTEKRQYVAGLMLLGDYALKLRGSFTVGSSRTNTTSTRGMKHSFYCPSSCFSEQRLGADNVTVFRETLHMHASGERMTNVRLDSSGDIASVAEANYFDFSRGAGFASREVPYQINTGDSFLTTCYYSEKDVLWGSSSLAEMCQSFLWYYPKQGGYSLSCGYIDPYARAYDTNTTSLSSLGCEMSYDRGLVDQNLERLEPTERCQKRKSYKTPSTKELEQQWPALLQLINTWAGKEDKSVNISVTIGEEDDNSNLDENCRLCVGGQRPTQRDTIVPGGFSWTCDELDAALPVLFTEPWLLLIPKRDVATCEKYQSAFAELCGCPHATEEIPSHRWQITIGLFALLLGLITYSKRKRGTARNNERIG